MTRRTVAIAGVIASCLAILASVMSSDSVRDGLAASYSYPNSQGLGLDEAASMTMTYLLAVAGAGLIVGSIFAAVRSWAASRTGWWIGAAFTSAGLAVAMYNATQVFPLMVKIAFFLPVAAGACWLTTTQLGESSGGGRRDQTALA